MGQTDSDESVYDFAITGDLDRHAAEALYLELRRLAKRYGFDIKEFRIEKVEDKLSS